MSIRTRHRGATLVAAVFEGRHVSLVEHDQASGTVRTAAIQLPIGDTETQSWLETGSATMRAALQQLGFVSREAAIVLPLSKVHYERAFLAPMPQAEIASAVRWRIAEELGVSADDLCIGHYLLGSTLQANKARFDVLAVAATRANVDRYTRLLEGSGLIPRIVETWPGAMARLVSHPERDSRPTLVVGATRESLLCCLVRGGRPCFVRFIPRVLATAGLPHASSSAKEPDGAPRLPSAASAWPTADIVHELTRCVRHLEDLEADDYRPQVGYALVDDEADSTVAHALTQATGITFHAGHVLAASEFTVGDASDVPTRTPVAALAALGLLRPRARLESSDSTVNLIDTKVRAQNRSPIDRVSVIRRTLTGATLVAVALTLVARHQLTAVNADIRQTQVNMTRTRGLVEATDAKAANLHLATCDDLRQPVTTSAILALITQILPSTTSLNELTLQLPVPTGPGKSVNVLAILAQGTATAPDSLTELTTSLQSVSSLQNIHYSRAPHKRTLNTGDNEFTLSVEMRLDRPATQSASRGDQ